MRAVIHRIETIDGDPLELATIENQSNAGQWVRILVGPADGPGEESFDVNVCTPEWLRDEIERTGPMVGRHLLIVNRWDVETVSRAISGLVAKVEGLDWQAVGERLGRIGYWEFEDYRA
ncbi:immunity 8 family protein [soil metagenome]